MAWSIAKGFIGGGLVGAFATAAAGYLLAVKPLEDRLDAFKAANDIAALHVRAYEFASDVRQFCGEPTGLFRNPSGETRNFIEGLGYSYRRSDFPLEDTLTWLDELEKEGIRFIASEQLPKNVAAQFFSDESAGKTLVFSSSILFSGEMERMFDFYRMVKEAGFPAPGTVVALINKSPLPDEEGFTVVRGPAGMEEVVVEKDQYRLPVKVAPRPC